MLNRRLLDGRETIPLVKPDTQIHEPAGQRTEGTMEVPLPKGLPPAGGTAEPRQLLEGRRDVHGTSS